MAAQLPTCPRKRRAKKFQLTLNQGIIVYTASHQWKQKQAEIVKLDPVVGEQAYLHLDSNKKERCMIAKSHPHGTNAGTYRIYSPPPVCCTAATADDVGAAVFVLMKVPSDEAPFRMGHSGLLVTLDGSTATIRIGGLLTSVSATAVRIQPSLFRYVPRDRIERIPPRFPREFADKVIEKCVLRPGSYKHLTRLRRLVRNDLNRNLKVQTQEMNQKIKPQSRAGFPIVLRPW